MDPDPLDQLGSISRLQLKIVLYTKLLQALKGCDWDTPSVVIVAISEAMAGLEANISGTRTTAAEELLERARPQ